MVSSKKLAFTICAGNYLSRAAVLAESIKRHCPEYDFYLFLIDDADPTLLAHVSGATIIAIDAVDIPRLSEMRARYGVIEFSTAVKPFCFQHLFRATDDDTHILYLDPDIMVFSDFRPIARELDDADILVTPHLLQPIMKKTTPAELRIAPSGIYNLGFLGLRKSDNTDAFLQWWALRLEEHCLCDHKEGLFYDQSWINFVPIYFSRVRVSTNPGLNVAVWNLGERSITRDVETSTYKVNATVPLIFFHFSQFRVDQTALNRLPLSDWAVPEESSPALNHLLDVYLEALLSAGHHQCNNIGYSFPGRWQLARLSLIIFGRIVKRLSRLMPPEARAMIRRQIQGL